MTFCTLRGKFIDLWKNYIGRLWWLFLFAPPAPQKAEASGLTSEAPLLAGGHSPSLGPRFLTVTSSIHGWRSVPLGILSFSMTHWALALLTTFLLLPDPVGGGGGMGVGCWGIAFPGCLTIPASPLQTHLFIKVSGRTSIVPFPAQTGIQSLKEGNGQRWNKYIQLEEDPWSHT